MRRDDGQQQTVRSDVEPPYRTWLAQLGDLVAEAAQREARGQEDGWHVALHLAALLDGLESLLLLELVTPEQARDMVRDAIEREVCAPVSGGAAA